MSERTPPATYRDAGVDIAAGNELVRRIAALSKATHDENVKAAVGGFASVYQVPGSDQLLVASCDGVGTKLKLAFLTGKHDSVGIDLVAMNVNDLICTGARPAFFLDYFATGKLQVDVAESVVRGIAEGCRQARCALIGGETAEMPDFYAAGEYDLAGFAVGLVAANGHFEGAAAVEGDVVIGLPSSGLHSNGYSLARRVLLSSDDQEAKEQLATKPEQLEKTLGETLLIPTRIYVDSLRAIAEAAEVRAAAHITGGGLIENPPRVIGDSLAFHFDSASWDVPPIMKLIQNGLESTMAKCIGPLTWGSAWSSWFRETAPSKP
jgi:phosphoribosylformylglycinamidine cyclo-ligase